ncbi:hypothetical protein [Pseudomonas sp. CF161]|uniref:hypothetical protein n=1 Tax=Pseudomonas sp. CF161 TaxID=911241 RepID=UPI0003552DBE|nr:hypothetical protein [Pseudomonas sp. CF161]EPL06502.1 hypothetical protein CF161_19754 [Pseudomonas sp. CF161]
MTDADTDRALSGCSVRDLQLYAAGCLEAYCTGKGLRHPSIDDLLKHLRAYPQHDHLLAWERAGALLAVNGRGDDLPQELVAVMLPQDIEAFSSIVDSAVEVGIVDLYGDSTHLPASFVRNIRSMLRRNGIDVPDMNETIST